MTSQERIQAAVGLRPPDRLPCGELFWDGTLEGWREQGMPGGVSAEDYFGLDLCTMFLDASPRLPQRLVRNEGAYIVYVDRFGYTVRKPAGVSGSLEFLSHVTTDRPAWDRLRPLFTLRDDEPARIDEASYFAHMGEYPSWEAARAKYHALRASGRYVLFRCYGPFNATWRHRGMESLLIDVAEDPQWVGEMLAAYQELVLAILGKCLLLGMRPDAMMIFEDLGWRQSMLISPASFRTLLKPRLAELGRFLRENGIDFWMHSDGAIQPIIEDLIECGLRVLNPLETAAGLDVRVLRDRYGGRLAFYGNLSVSNLIADDTAALLEEIRAKAPLARDGGYIFGSDHSVPPQVTLARYRWVLEQARAAFAGERR
jgi:uroporphyrinogen decarboxylase